MAVRPPPSDSNTPDTLAFGIAALSERLDDASVQFPATADHLVQALDDPEIPYDVSGGTVPLSEVLERIPTQRFERRGDLLEQLHPVFEEYREASGTGLLGRLRSLLPF